MRWDCHYQWRVRVCVWVFVCQYAFGDSRKRKSSPWCVALIAIMTPNYADEYGVFCVLNEFKFFVRLRMGLRFVGEECACGRACSIIYLCIDQVRLDNFDLLGLRPAVLVSTLSAPIRLSLLIAVPCARRVFDVSLPVWKAPTFNLFTGSKNVCAPRRSSNRLRNRQSFGLVARI